MTEALSLGLMDVYLIDRCSLLLWRRSAKSKPAAPAAVSVFPPPSLSLPLVWFSGDSRAANAYLLLPVQRLKLSQHISYSPSPKSLYTLN